MKSIQELLKISESISNTPEVPEIKSTPKNIDVGIKHVEVPDDFVNEILQFSTKKKIVESTKNKTPKSSKPKELVEADKLEERLTSLVERLSSLLKEARVVMNEMTSTGSIGVGVQSNLLTSKKKKKKKRPNGPC